MSNKSGDWRDYECVAAMGVAAFNAYCEAGKPPLPLARSRAQPNDEQVVIKRRDDALVTEQQPSYTPEETAAWNRYVRSVCFEHWCEEIEPQLTEDLTEAIGYALAETKKDLRAELLERIERIEQKLGIEEPAEVIDLPNWRRDHAA
jgi:hypothetical protein